MSTGLGEFRSWYFKDSIEFDVRIAFLVACLKARNGKKRSQAFSFFEPARVSRNPLVIVARVLINNTPILIPTNIFLAHDI